MPSPKADKAGGAFLPTAYRRLAQVAIPGAEQGREESSLDDGRARERERAFGPFFRCELCTGCSKIWLLFPRPRPSWCGVLGGVCFLGRSANTIISINAPRALSPRCARSIGSCIAAWARACGDGRLRAPTSQNSHSRASASGPRRLARRPPSSRPSVWGSPSPLQLGGQEDPRSGRVEEVRCLGRGLSLLSAFFVEKRLRAG